MFISTKKHNRIKEEVAQLYQKKIDSLTRELEYAQNLKSIVEKLYPLHRIDGSTIRLNVSGSSELILPDKVPVYVEDYLGGKVIKQEATKVIHITKEGEVKTGLTKQSADKGYSYKLIRDNQK